MIEKYDKLSVERINNFYLDSEDYHILSMLYKPLVGPGAINYYLSLYELSCFDSPITKDKIFIMDLISDNYLKDEIVDKFIGYLESVKLIKFNDGKITLYPNYNENEFFILPFGSLFKANVSITHFKDTLDRFSIKTEVTDTQVLSLSKALSNVAPKERKDNNFDFITFKNALVDVDKETLDSDKCFFSSLSTAYNYSLDDLIRIMYEVNLDNGKYNKDDILKIAYEKYLNILKKKERIKNKEHSDDAFIEYFKNNSAETILTNTKNKSVLSKADTDILKRMRTELKIDEPMISLLITYSITVNEGKLFPYTYYDKVKKDWDLKDITDVENAYYYIIELYKEKKPKQAKKVVDAEDWFKDFWDKALKEGENND